MAGDDHEALNLAKNVESGLQAHDLSQAVQDMARLRQSLPADKTAAILSDATDQLHKDGKLPGLKLIGADKDGLIVAGANNHIYELNKQGDLTPPLNLHVGGASNDAPPSQFSYDPSTNTEYYNVSAGPNQTQVGVDTQVQAGPASIAAEASRQFGSVNVMYEHDLGDNGQDAWISTPVGNGGNNYVEAEISNQQKPQVLYVMSNKNQTNTWAIGGGLDGSISLNFRKRF